MFKPWTPVVVTNADHPRSGQAGVVESVAEDGAVSVKFDIGGVVEVCLPADLKALS